MKALLSSSAVHVKNLIGIMLLSTPRFMVAVLENSINCPLNISIWQLTPLRGKNFAI
jgi:hypothetical protein